MIEQERFGEGSLIAQLDRMHALNSELREELRDCQVDREREQEALAEKTEELEKASKQVLFCFPQHPPFQV